jgi:cyclopropane-fatty-acyl-phospholipid synthase
MTTFRERRSPSPAQAPTSADRLSLAGIVELLSDGRFPVRFTAYDGSATGPADSEISVHLATPRGATYVFTAPGDLGMARAYIAGDLHASGVHPGDPYVAMRVMADEVRFRRPTLAELAVITLAGLGAAAAGPPAAAGIAAPVAPDTRRSGALPAPGFHGDPPSL